MHHLKARVFAVVLILVSVGLVYYNWHQLLEPGLDLGQEGPPGIAANQSLRQELQHE